MKKVIVSLACMAFCLAISLPAWSVELPADTVQANKVPASFATVKGGNVVFGQSATAYSPEQLDMILTAYGGTLSPNAKVPASYATVKGGNVVFGKTTTIYSPDSMHEILTAYGFTTTPEAMAKLKDPTSYATAKGAKIIFGESATAYSPEEFNMLMAAYQLAAKAMVAEEPVVVVVVAEPKAEEKVIVVAAEPKVVILAFEDVHFDFDKSTLTPEAKTILKRNFQLLTKNPKAKIRIAGYTSASGTEAYNQKLSERRANSVRDYLVSEGILPRDRLVTIGYGEKNPAMYEAAPKEIYSKDAMANMRVLFEVFVK